MKAKSKASKSGDTKEKKIPYYRKPDDMSIDEWQSGLRKQYGIQQEFEIENVGDGPVFSDYNVYNPESGKTYKVAIRSKEKGLNFCSCPDFKVNNLGTCKHIENVIYRIKQKKKNVSLLDQGNIQFYSSVSLKYGAERKIYLRIGENNYDKIKDIASEFFDSDNFLKPTAFAKFELFLEKVNRLDPEFRCYPDAMDFIIDVRNQSMRKFLITEKFSDGIDSPEFDNLINAKLYRYQKEGVLFAAKNGRCLIADDMGLGKTIQAISAVEIFTKEFNVEKVLIICPTSLKYQWKSEIEKFTTRDVLPIEGPADKRKMQYKEEAFYKIVSYNSVIYDLDSILSYSPDVVILDEAQRIKNWKTKTAQAVKSIQSEFALVLTGTPLENKLEELHSIVEFIDRYKLGALFRFLSNHQVKEDTGKVIGYKNLNEISRTLDNVLIRRKKTEILKELPERVDKNYFVPVTKEQMDIHSDYSSTVSRLVNKWRARGFLSEPERRRLMLSLSCMRMVSDSTYILDQETRFDTKINELMALLIDVFESGEEKVVIFSQWERMTRLVAAELKKIEVGYEYLHGGVPSAKRKDLLENFANDRSKRVFLSTDAGGVGLNLQSANIVINLDIPWNPAVLEQRIARVWRIGQGRHVRVVNFVSTGTIEHRMLNVLNFKQSLFTGVLDNGEDSVVLDQKKFDKLMEIVEDVSEKPYDDSLSDNDDISDNEAYGEKKEKEKAKDTSQKPDNKENVQKHEIPAKEKETAKKGATPDNNVGDLISSGIDFLQKFGKVLSDKENTRKMVDSLVTEDKETGKKSINIPINDDKTVDKVVDVIDTFLNMFKGK